MHFRKVRLFYNRRSGPARARFDSVQKAVAESWATVADDLAWYFPNSREESNRMLQTALADGADCVLVAGGDGTVSSIGTQLAGTGVALGVIPMGSGNGLARHFDQALSPAESLMQLAHGCIRDMDLGLVNGHRFLVSASVAWDAALVSQYNSMPLRGVLSYVLAAGMTFLEYKPQPLEFVIDGGASFSLRDPFLCTIGNLSGWGGGAIIDADARSDDGRMELLLGARSKLPRMLTDLPEVFTGTGTKNLPGIQFQHFSTLTIDRVRPDPIQLDGELVDCGRTLRFSLNPERLRILTPVHATAGFVPPLEASSKALEPDLADIVDSDPF